MPVKLPPKTYLSRPLSFIPRSRSVETVKSTGHFTDFVTPGPNGRPVA